MIVCQCRGITDRAIRKAVLEGARSRNDVVRTCEAGKYCGGCASAIDEIIEIEQRRVVRARINTLELATG